MFFAHFLIGLFGVFCLFVCFLLLRFEHSSYTLYSRCWSCVGYVAGRYFLPLCGLSFHPLHRGTAWKLLLLVKSSQFFLLQGHAFGVKSKNSSPSPRFQRFSPVSSKSFVVLHFTFKSMIHFELIFVYGIGFRLRFFFFFLFCFWISSCSSTIY